MSDTNAVIDHGAAHKYRTEIPNIVLELGLRPFSLALYVHLKRTAGDGGVCEKSTRRLAREMGKVSIGSVSVAKADLARPRDELDGEALIRVAPIDDGKGTRIARDVIIIADIWPANMDRFGRSHSEHAVHSMNGGRSYSEHGRSHTERGRSYSEHEEDPLKKEPKGRTQRKNTAPNGGAEPSASPVVDSWAPLKDAVLESFGVPGTVSNYKFAQKAVGAAQVNGLDGARGAKAWAAFVSEQKASGGWEFARLHSIGPLFGKWITDTLERRGVKSARSQAMATDPAGAPPDWRAAVYFDHDGVTKIRDPQLVLPRFGVDRNAPLTAWPAWLREVYRGTVYA